MKHYFVFGYDNNKEIMSMSFDGFSDLTLAIEYLATIDKSFNPFICVRLINIWKETIMDKSNLQIVWEILNASLYDLQCGVKEDAVNAIEEAIELLEAEGVGE
jgi:hypothetical protein